MNYFNNDIRELFINHYVIYVYLSCFGTLQLVSAISNLRGIMILSNVRANKILGIIFLASGFIFFFSAPLFISAQWMDYGNSKATIENFASVRNVNDIDGGLHGTAQFLLFLLGCILSFFTSVIISAILMFINNNSKTLKVNEQKYKGIFLLKNKNYYSSLRFNFRGRFINDD
ncbi:MAG: hypothetical protein CL746_02395 [Chloroflexi bacterium]|nr:hypothetical protein [Chloroflexota bacterium]|tara:strand:+ start:49 stop:567 length:519 start_codon:yes stop_codon:yes gene_type:complete